MEPTEILYYAQKLNRDLCELGVEGEVLRKCRDELFAKIKDSDEAMCFMYQLTLIEMMLHAGLIGLRKAIKDNKEKERFVLEQDGKTYIVDFEGGLGTRTETVKMDAEGYKDYVNRRAGYKVFED